MLFIFIDSIILWYIAFKKLFLVRAKDIGLAQALEALKSGDGVLLGFKGPRAGFVREFVKSRTGVRDVDAGMLKLLSERAVREVEKSMGVLYALCASAPLLGLLGTVMGMIKVFFALTLFGTGNVKAIASGISEALITTQGGLVVAIPGFYMAHFLRRRVEELKRDALEIALSLERHL